MKNGLKKQMLGLFGTMYEAHTEIKKLMNAGEIKTASDLLGECQNMAIRIGTTIDESEGENTEAVKLLEDYCEIAYEVSQLSDGNKACKMLDKAIIKAENSVKNDIPSRLEIAIMPYKASMWDSLESIWKAADEDPECDVFVIPIPYYDRNPDHSLGKFHYEGNDFPDYVPIIDYEKYDLEKQRPDVIYIHNPYDDSNFVTSVDPKYYSYELKKYTEMLVYIPYYVTVMLESTSLDPRPVYYNADKIVLLSDLLIERANRIYAGDKNMRTKFVALGSPIIDAVLNSNKEDFTLPASWKSMINGKRVVMFDLTLFVALVKSGDYLKKLKITFDYFQNNDTYVLWWRPHPLTQNTLKTMRPQLMDEYDRIVQYYLDNKIGIYDDTPDVMRAVKWCDIYYGNKTSSVYALFCYDGKITVSDGFAQDDIISDSINDFAFDFKNNSIDNSDRALLNRNNNADGTAGEKIHKHIKKWACENI